MYEFDKLTSTRKDQIYVRGTGWSSWKGEVGVDLSKWWTTWRQVKKKVEMSVVMLVRNAVTVCCGNSDTVQKTRRMRSRIREEQLSSGQVWRPGWRGLDVCWEDVVELDRGDERLKTSEKIYTWSKRRNEDGWWKVETRTDELLWHPLKDDVNRERIKPNRTPEPTSLTRSWSGSKTEDKSSAPKLLIKDSGFTCLDKRETGVVKHITPPTPTHLPTLTSSPALLSLYFPLIFHSAWFIPWQGEIGSAR